MEFTLKEKLMLAIKFRKHKQNSDTFNEFNGDDVCCCPRLLLSLLKLLEQLHHNLNPI